MGLSKEEVIKKLRTSKKFYVPYAQATQLPYVSCDEETFNDQVRIFATEKLLQEFGKKLAAEKTAIRGVVLETKNFPVFYGTLFTIGVNSVVWVEDGGELEVELTDFVRQPDYSKQPPEKQPLLNPSLQLSAIYFMQELRRPEDARDAGKLRELEEEVLADLVRSEFLIALEENQEDPKKMKLPYLKNKKDEILHPIFSDVMEYERFARGKKYKLAKVQFSKLPGVIIPDAVAFVVNPMGVNLILNKEQMKNLAK